MFERPKISTILILIICCLKLNVTHVFHGFTGEMNFLSELAFTQLKKKKPPQSEESRTTA